MKTRARWYAVVLAVLLVVAGGARAEEDEGSEATSLEDELRVQKEVAKGTLLVYSGTAKFVGNERLSETEARSVIAHYASFAKVYRGEGDDAPRSRVDAHFEKTGTYDPSLILATRAYREWADSHGLDGRAWLRRAFRAELLLARARLAKSVEELRVQVEELEDLRVAVENETIEKAADEGREILTKREKALAAIPAPTEEEKKVLEKHRKTLEALLG